MDMQIVKVEGSEVLDSRGNPTVAVEVTLADGTIGQAMDGALVGGASLTADSFLRIIHFR